MLADSKVASKNINTRNKRAIWQHEWTSPRHLSSRENFGVHQIVHGPFQTPKLIKASPCVVNCQPTQEPLLADVNSRRNFSGIRRGIPDPWIEYLALRGFCGEHDRKTVRRHLKLGCDSVRLTEAVWNDLGLSLVQGIPDPWKESPYETKSFIKRKKKSSQKRKSKIKLRGSSKDPLDSRAPPKNLVDEFIGSKDRRMNEGLRVRKISDFRNTKGNFFDESKLKTNENTVFFDPEIQGEKPVQKYVYQTWLPLRGKISIRGSNFKLYRLKRLKYLHLCTKF